MRFDEMNLSEGVLRSLGTMGYERATQVQARAIPVAMVGRDVLGAAKTGTGKTLAFLVPAVELLVRTRVRREQGTAVLVVTPTRELAIQIGEVAKGFFGQRELGGRSVAVVMGGAKRSD